MGVQDEAPGVPAAMSTSRLRELLSVERVKIPLAGVEKDAILSELVDLIAREHGLTEGRSEILDAVLQRESVLSTGIGDGIAIPHAKYGGTRQVLMAAGVSREPVDFGALDGKPVRLFFLLVGPETAAGSQVRALSRISRFMRDESLRERLVGAEGAEGFLRILEEAENAQ